jgi:LacI family transcriptional regulator
MEPKTDNRHILVVGFAMGGLDAEVLRGFNLFRRSAGCWVLHDAGHQRSSLDQFLESPERYSGVLANVTEPGLVRQLQASGLPVVDCSSLLADRPFPRVTVNNLKVGQLASEYFNAPLFRSHLFVSNAMRLFEQKRWEGFAEGVRAFGGHPQWIVLDTHGFDTRIAKQCGAIHPDPTFSALLRELNTPAAVFVASDRVGMHLCDSARMCGLNVPVDLSVLGVDDVESICDSCEPPLSSIRLPGERIGFEAGRRLQRAMQGDRNADAVLMPPQMVHVRASTDPGAGDSDVARAIRYMRENLGARLQVKDIAAHLHMHPRTFLRHFQKEVGRNPHEELLRIQIEAVCNRLLHSQDPIYTIAEECGFGDADQLTRHFKKATGLTPSQFRTG